MNNKKIIFHVTKCYMKLNRGRTMVTFIGILFMVILMTCVFVGKDTVIDYLERVAALDKGSWHLMVYDLSEEEARQITAMEEVSRSGYSVPLMYTEFPMSGSQSTPYLEVKAYSPEIFSLLNIEVVEGRLPENEHELVITETAVMDGSEVAIGDSIHAEYFNRTITGINPEVESTVFPALGFVVHYEETLPVPGGFAYFGENEDFRENQEYTGETGDYTVVGIIKSPYFEKVGGGGYPAMTCLTEELYTEGNSVGKEAAGFQETKTVNVVLELDLDRTDSVYQVRQRIRALAGEDTEIDSNELVLVFTANGSDSVINGIVVFLEVFFTVLIMAASLILIYNVFNMSFSERTKYLGMLSSIGATRRQKRWSIYYEVLYLLIPALPLGILLGILVVQAGMTALKPNMDMLIDTVRFGMTDHAPVILSVNGGNLVLITMMCLVTVMISAFIPAVKIGKVGPIESIRGNIHTKKKRYKTKYSLLQSGKALELLAVNNTGRCRHLTRGIIRSIAIFGVLVMVTLYGALAVIQIVEKKAGEGDSAPDVTGYEYVLISFLGSEYDYQYVRRLIMENHAVADGKEFSYIFSEAHIDSEYLSEEYKKTYEELAEYALQGDEASAHKNVENYFSYSHTINLLVLEDEEYQRVAAKGNADSSIAEDASVPSILLYNFLEMDTDHYRFEGRNPDYRYFAVNDVYASAIGDIIPFSIYNSEQQELVTSDITTAGYIDAAALQGVFRIQDGMFWGVINQSAADALIEASGRKDSDESLASHILFFNLKEAAAESMGNAESRENMGNSGNLESAESIGNTESAGNVESTGNMESTGNVGSTESMENTAATGNTGHDESNEQAEDPEQLVMEGELLLKQLENISEESDGEFYLGRADMINGMGSLKEAIGAIIKILAYSFTALISMVCLLNLYNSIRGRAMERKRETAMLRSMGMTDHQLDRMHLFENVILLVRGILISVVISAVFIWFLSYEIVQRFGNVSLPVPWGMAALIIGIIFAAVTVITKVCYNQVKNSSIVEEIRSETV